MHLHNIILLASKSHPSFNWMVASSNRGVQVAGLSLRRDCDACHISLDCVAISFAVASRSGWRLVVTTCLWLCAIFLCGCSREGYSHSVSAPPARRAARGEVISSIVTCREHPHRVSPIAGMEECVTDRQLCDALCSAMPMWHPPTVPSLLHELLLWGKDSHFSEEFVGQERSGDLMLRTLLSDALCKQNTVPGESDYLIDSQFGIFVARNGTADAAGYRGEGHYGQLLKILAESGVPASAPVATASGRVGTVKDLLQDAIMRYSPVFEQEFIAIALALYLPPAASTWTDQYDNEYHFDDLARALLRIPHGRGSCGGCHVPYAVAVLLRVNDTYPILSPETREEMHRWLAALSAILEESQCSAGGWDLHWPLTSKIPAPQDDPCLDRITMTGHHLEWIALAPETARPRLDTIKHAVIALLRDIRALPELGGPRLFKTLLPCSHAARALCLFRGVSAYSTWNRFATNGDLERTPRGYRLRAH